MLFRSPAVGVGFTDVGTGRPGTDSREFGGAEFSEWGPDFLGRLGAHAGRVRGAIGCACGRCGAPAVVAFSGKKQFVDLYNAVRGPGEPRLAGARVPVGAPLPPGLLPRGWPLPPDTEVWVMTSTSGAAAMTHEARVAPWRALAERVARAPWPRGRAC